MKYLTGLVGHYARRGGGDEKDTKVMHNPQKMKTVVALNNEVPIKMNDKHTQYTHNDVLKLKGLSDQINGKLTN